MGFVTFLELFGIGLLGSLMHFLSNYGKTINCSLVDYAAGEAKRTLASLSGIVMAALGLMQAGSVDVGSLAVFAAMLGAGFISDNTINKAPEAA